MTGSSFPFPFQRTPNYPNIEKVSAKHASSTRPSWRCSQFSHKSESSLVESAGTILRSFGGAWSTAERRENCWPASWRGSNYSNDRGRFRFSSSHPHRFAQKRFNCRNRFRWLRWDCAQRWCSHPFLISDTIFQNSHLTFLSCLLSSTQSCCRFN